MRSARTTFLRNWKTQGILSFQISSSGAQNWKFWNRTEYCMVSPIWTLFLSMFSRHACAGLKDLEVKNLMWQASDQNFGRSGHCNLSCQVDEKRVREAVANRQKYRPWKWLWQLECFKQYSQISKHFEAYGSGWCPISFAPLTGTWIPSTTYGLLELWCSKIQWFSNSPQIRLQDLAFRWILCWFCWCPAQAAVVLAACVRGLCSHMAVLAVRSKSISWGGSPLRSWYRLDVQFKTHQASSIYVIIRNFADGFLNHFGPLDARCHFCSIFFLTSRTLWTNKWYADFDVAVLLPPSFPSLFLSPSVWQNVFQDEIQVSQLHSPWCWASWLTTS